MEHVDQDLDRLLREAAPVVSAGDPEVVRAARELAVRAEGEVRPYRLRGAARRPAVAIGAAALVFVGTGVAAAATFFPDWFDGRSPDLVVEGTTVAGSDCLQAFRVDPHGTTEDDPAVVAARQTLATLDAEALDLEQARRELIAVGAPSEQLSDPALIGHAVFQALLDELDRQGLDTEAFSLEGATDCAADQL